MSDTTTDPRPSGPVPAEEMGAAVMPEDSGPALTPYEAGDTAEYEGMSVDELADAHNDLDAQRNEINAKLLAVDSVRARKEFEEQQAGTSSEAPAQTADAAGAESGEAVGSK